MLKHLRFPNVAILTVAENVELTTFASKACTLTNVHVSRSHISARQKNIMVMEAE